MNKKIYLYGQILGTHSFYIKDGFPKPDEYSEIEKKYFLPGGETGTAATVLASLGARVVMDGTHIGTEVAPMLKPFYEKRGVDISSLFFDPEYNGLMDYVLIHGLVRSPMGFFQSLYESNIKRWNMPKEEDIKDAVAAGIDPFFMEETMEAARLCIKHHVPYVTIDCPHTSFLHEHAAINVVSKECLEKDYKNMDLLEVMNLLKESTEGLSIITTGSNNMLYGRRGEAVKSMETYKVEVKSTLGAGDTFKAGCIYALANGMSDDEMIHFASACSAIAIQRFPLPLNPPTIADVRALL